MRRQRPERYGPRSTRFWPISNPKAAYRFPHDLGTGRGLCLRPEGHIRYPGHCRVLVSRFQPKVSFRPVMNAQDLAKAAPAILTKSILFQAAKEQPRTITGRKCYQFRYPNASLFGTPLGSRKQRSAIQSIYLGDYRYYAEPTCAPRYSFSEVLSPNLRNFRSAVSRATRCITTGAIHTRTATLCNSASVPTTTTGAAAAS